MEDFGFVVGWLCGRGSVVYDEKHGNYYLTFRKVDEHLIRKLESVYGKFTKLKKEVRVYGKHFVKEVLKMIGDGKSWCVPNLAFSHEGFRRGFLMGYFHVRGKFRLRIRVVGGKKVRSYILYVNDVNLKGLRGVKKLLEMEGIKSLLFKTGVCYRLEIHGKTWVELFKRKVLRVNT